MWITGDVNLPESLLEAQQGGRLVAFVGAGVSVGPPSGLPLFEALTKQIAAEAQITWEDKYAQRLDWFLGRWEDQGIAVHDLVKNKIAIPGSRPNQLHDSIVRLFPSATQMRIVTTNYDTHLTAAAATLFGADPQIYEAPALPLGRDFTGIIYLHGSVDQAPSSLVVTDRDFGHAYLTDAWAARFLQEMFRKHTVFFIGYSHNDIVMNYLARGLLPDSRARFGFASDPIPRVSR
jgi:SIR2-like domain